jgi:hypothetical protein
MWTNTELQLEAKKVIVFNILYVQNVIIFQS